MTTSRTLRSLAITASVAALACVGAAPAPAMVGSQSEVSEPPVVQDLRSPDTRDAADGYSPSGTTAAVAVSRDLRSPDTRDAAAGYDPQPVGQPATITSSDGFDWVSAAIGGAVLGGLILLLVAVRPTRFVHRGALHT